MSEETEAQRIADKLEHQICFGSYDWERVDKLMLDAAKKLRRFETENKRLKAENERMRNLVKNSEDRTQSGLVTDSQKMADARLIAAAPELMEALQDMLSAENTYPFGGMSESEIAAIAKARAAINKVTGETP